MSAIRFACWHEQHMGVRCEPCWNLRLEETQKPKALMENVEDGPYAREIIARSERAQRDAIIEECAELCDTASQIYSDFREKASAEALASSIRALKNAAPDAGATSGREVPAAAPVAAPEDVNCPFCGNGGFDLIGLKAHLDRADCTEYEETERLPPSLFG